GASAGAAPSIGAFGSVGWSAPPSCATASSDHAAPAASPRNPATAFVLFMPVPTSAALAWLSGPGSDCGLIFAVPGADAESGHCAASRREGARKSSGFKPDQ